MAWEPLEESSGDESARGEIRPRTAQETSGAGEPGGFGASAGRRAQPFLALKLRERRGQDLEPHGGEIDCGEHTLS